MKIGFNLKKWILFIGCLLLAYGICQGVCNHYILSDQEKQTWRNNVENVFLMIVLGTVVYIFGNYDETFPNFNTILFMLSMPVAWAFFEDQYNTRKLDKVEDWDSNQRKLNIGLLIIVLFILLGNLYVAKRREKLLGFIFYFSLAVTIITVLFLTSSYPDSSQQRFKLHFWLVGWILAFFTRYKDSIFTEIGAGFALGLFVHGLALYRDTLQFYNCREKSYVHCNRNGPYICTNDPSSGAENFGDVNWYGIIIIGGILSLFYFFNPYFRDSKNNRG